MRVFVCGKGGSGKTVVSILISRILSEKGRVYIVDSDESNEMLHRLLGVQLPRPLAEYLGGKKNIFKIGEINIVNALKAGSEGIRISKLPQEYVSYSEEGIGLVIIGKVRRLGEGCACPFNFLTRIFLKNLMLEPNEYVVVDTDAGVEHVGRGVEEAADMIIFVADPTAESIQLARIMKNIADENNIQFKLILNKVMNNIYEAFEKLASKHGLRMDGVVSFDSEVFMSCLEGNKLRAKSAYNELKKLVNKWFS